MAQPIPVTLEGYSMLKDELKRLKSVERPKIINEIARAREHGDLSENAEYHAAKEKQGFIEGRIAELEDRFARAQIVDPAQMKVDKVAFSATVTLYNTETGEESTYQIVGEDEADPKANKLSINSPLARACIGKSLDDTVRVVLPTGVREYEVVGIEYK